MTDLVEYKVELGDKYVVEDKVLLKGKNVVWNVVVRVNVELEDRVVLGGNEVEEGEAEVDGKVEVEGKLVVGGKEVGLKEVFDDIVVVWLDITVDVNTVVDEGVVDATNIEVKYWIC